MTRKSCAPVLVLVSIVTGCGTNPAAPTPVTSITPQQAAPAAPLATLVIQEFSVTEWYDRSQGRYHYWHGCLTAPAVAGHPPDLGERTSLTLHSYVTNTDQTFASLRDLERDAFYARIWGGLHFRTAMVDAYSIGHTAADQVLRKLR